MRSLFLLLLFALVPLSAHEGQIKLISLKEDPKTQVEVFSVTSEEKSNRVCGVYP